MRECSRAVGSTKVRQAARQVRRGRGHDTDALPAPRRTTAEDRDRSRRTDGHICWKAPIEWESLYQVFACRGGIGVGPRGPTDAGTSGEWNRHSKTRRSATCGGPHGLQRGAWAQLTLEPTQKVAVVLGVCVSYAQPDGAKWLRCSRHVTCVELSWSGPTMGRRTQSRRL